MKNALKSDALRKAYPPMRAEFMESTRRLLESLPEQEKEIIMKKKLSIGLVLAIILIIAALTCAVALTLPRAFFEDVGKMQVESGYYDDWTLDEKLDMLALMEKYGVTVDESVLAKARDKALPETDREAALDAFMAEKYGIYGRTDVIGLESILIAEKGDMVYWSVEDKAWYITFQQDLGLLSMEEERLYTLPDENDMTQAQAEAVAREAIMAQLGWTDEKLAGYAAYFACLTQFPAPEKLWEVAFVHEDGERAYVTFPAAKGTVAAQAEEILVQKPDTWRQEMDAKVPPLIEKYGPMLSWGIEALHEFNPDIYFLPGDGDITPDAATESAVAALLAEFPGLTREELAALRISHQLTESWYNDTLSRTYFVSFQNEKYFALYNANVDAATGDCWRVYQSAGE